ncbi:hypothetical protein BKA70DRAFT_1304422 [Coprinopsis sp. MPI-PUGE-AT-0042]|nr:hypothetical protein BKA70DRAFT_1304422 [Coprinopsis sp. MPI-PUGE-AT-0042]
MPLPLHETCTDLYITEAGHYYYLHAKYTGPSGEEKESEPFNLNFFLGNRRGHFSLRGDLQFGWSASDVRMEGTVLKAKLDMGDHRGAIEDAIDVDHRLQLVGDDSLGKKRFELVRNYPPFSKDNTTLRSSEVGDLHITQPQTGEYYLHGSFMPDRTTVNVEPFPLNRVIGNHGARLIWGGNDFGKSIESVVLDDTALVVKCFTQDRSRTYEDILDLDELFCLHIDGNQVSFKALQVPMVVWFPQLPAHVVTDPKQATRSLLEEQDISGKEIEIGLEGFKSPRLRVLDVHSAKAEAPTEEKARFGYAAIGGSLQYEPKIHYGKFKVDASASAFHLQPTSPKHMDEVVARADFGKIGAEASVECFVWPSPLMENEAGLTIPIYAGFEAYVRMADCAAGPVELKLGLGADSQLGFKDQSFKIKWLGTGVSIGRKVGFSIHGSGIVVDLSKLASIFNGSAGTASPVLLKTYKSVDAPVVTVGRPTMVLISE